MSLKYLLVMLAYFKPFPNYTASPTTKALVLCPVSSMAFVVTPKVFYMSNTVFSFSLYSSEPVYLASVQTSFPTLSFD